MGSVSFGTARQFDSSAAGYNSVCRLDDGTFAVAFRDEDDSNKGKVIIGTLSGVAITIADDSATTFESGQTSYMQISALDSTHFAIVYIDISDSNYCKAVTGSVSGTAITLGSVADIYVDGTVDSCGCAALNSEYFTAIYCEDTGNDTYGKVCSVSGATITAGSAQTLVDANNVDNPYSSQAVALDDSKIVCLYKHTPGYVGMVAVTVDKDNKTMSPGTPVTRGAVAGMAAIAIDAFDSSYFITGAGSWIFVGEVDGTIITLGTSQQLEPNAFTPRACATDSTHWATVYYDDLDSDKGKILQGTHADKVISIDGTISTFETDDTDDLAICRMGTGYFVVPFMETP